MITIELTQYGLRTTRAVSMSRLNRKYKFGRLEVLPPIGLASSDHGRQGTTGRGGGKSQIESYIEGRSQSVWWGYFTTNGTRDIHARGLSVCGHPRGLHGHFYGIIGCSVKVGRKWGKQIFQENCPLGIFENFMGVQDFVEISYCEDLVLVTTFKVIVLFVLKLDKIKNAWSEQSTNIGILMGQVKMNFQKCIFTELIKFKRTKY